MKAFIIIFGIIFILIAASEMGFKGTLFMVALCVVAWIICNISDNKKNKKQ